MNIGTFIGAVLALALAIALGVALSSFVLPILGWTAFVAVAGGVVGLVLWFVARVFGFCANVFAVLAVMIGGAANQVVSMPLMRRLGGIAVVVPYTLAAFFVLLVLYFILTGRS